MGKRIKVIPCQNGNNYRCQYYNNLHPIYHEYTCTGCIGVPCMTNFSPGDGTQLSEVLIKPLRQHPEPITTSNAGRTFTISIMGDDSRKTRYHLNLMERTVLPVAMTMIRNVMTGMRERYGTWNGVCRINHTCLDIRV